MFFCRRQPSKTNGLIACRFRNSWLRLSGNCRASENTNIFSRRVRTQNIRMWRNSGNRTPETSEKDFAGFGIWQASRICGFTICAISQRQRCLWKARLMRLSARWPDTARKNWKDTNIFSPEFSRQTTELIAGKLVEELGDTKRDTAAENEKVAPWRRLENRW